MKSGIFIFLFILLVSMPGYSQAKFQEVTIPAGFQLIAGSEGISVGDFNNDGFEDVYIIFPNGKNQLCKNKGDGTFTEVAENAGVAVSNNSKAAIWGDINNDGHLDLYVGNVGKYDQLFLNKGDETFEEISQPAGIFHLGHPKSVNMADINNDGYLDIYISNFLSQNVMYLNNGNNTFQNFTNPSLAFDTGKSMGTIFFDYDNDGDSDLYLVHDGNEPNFLYQNNGSGVFTNVAAAAGAATESNGMGVDIADVNNDGYLDIYITNLYENILLKNNGNGTFSDISESAGIEDFGMGWGVTFLDFDNDGRMDVYVANDSYFSPYPNVLYRNLGNLTFEKVEIEGPISNMAASYGAICFDYDLDGYVDLAVANRAVNDHFQLFQNADRPGNWMGIKLLGVQSNRNAVGAKIKIIDEHGMIHYKELTAGHGWTSQNSNVFHFGLGTAEAIQEMTIFWPSGLEQSVDPVEINQFYTIEEGSSPYAGLHSSVTTSVEEGILHDLNLQVFPNPSHGEFTISFEAPEKGEMQMEIYDQAGKKINTIYKGIIPAGRFEIGVNGMKKGLYFLKIMQNGKVISNKTTIN